MVWFKIKIPFSYFDYVIFMPGGWMEHGTRTLMNARHIQGIKRKVHSMVAVGKLPGQAIWSKGFVR